MQITQSWAYGQKHSGPGAGTGYRNDPVTLLISASSDANPTPYSVLQNDAFIEVDASNQNVQLILPAAAQSLGQRKRIKRVDATYAAANTVSVIDVSGANVEGATTLSLTAQGAVADLISDGTSWQVVGGSNSAAWGSTGAIVAVTVGASPFAYTAPAAGTVLIVGGTVSAVTLKRGTASAVSVGATAGSVPVSAGDIVTVTYSAAPTMSFVPR
ncbi:hypothetical protein [Burkholderia glumae]|uniref:hypothetical protein n=1 Tax=Burkholderia glumae TaxID=337 RepID=UPI001AE5750A|nr:hypothetical protein [Burkholderia glumae]QTP32816.1 hypothetical protein B7759_01394 [Burkholderia glumae]